jgi:hypothetical protein
MLCRCLRLEVWSLTMVGAWHSLWSRSEALSEAGKRVLDFMYTVRQHPTAKNDTAKMITFNPCFSMFPQLVYLSMVHGAPCLKACTLPSVPQRNWIHDYVDSIWSQDNAVGTASGYGLDDTGFGVQVRVGSRMFSPAQSPKWFWGPPSPLSNGYPGPSPRGGVDGAWSWPLISI